MTTQPEPGWVPDWTLGWRLQRSLAHANISADQIAKDLGVHRTTISRWLNDKGAPPRTIYVKQWAMRTGVPYEWISEGTIPSPAPGPGSGISPGETGGNMDHSSMATIHPLRSINLPKLARTVAA